MRILLSCLLFLCLANAANAGEKATVTQLLSATATASGQQVTVPDHPKIVVSTYEIPPHARLPVHKHPYARYAYVLSGDLAVVDTVAQKTYRYKAGDFIIEMRDAWHYGENTGDAPLRLLVIDQIPQNISSNTVVKAGKTD